MSYLVLYDQYHMVANVKGCSKIKFHKKVANLQDIVIPDRLLSLMLWKRYALQLTSRGQFADFYCYTTF